ncbi:MAG: DNA repair protein RecN [Acidobacteriota bacterium]
MLRFLGVRNLAVIEHMEVEFEPGLNLLTGETGAGKSVLIEAIALLVGGRASADLVRTGEESASVQAVFERPDGREVIVRREISAQGRSRAFIDDALATTTALREIGVELLDLHGQHEHQTLLDPSTHLTQLDAWLAEDELCARVATAFERWRAVVAQRERTQLDGREKQARIDMATFQLQEIDKVGPEADEDDRLTTERTVLGNADRLSRLSTEAYAALYDSEDAALTGLALVWKRLADLAAIDPRFDAYVEQKPAIKSALEDLAYFLRSYAAELDASPDRLQAVEDRLAHLERLKRKYGPGMADVLVKRDALRLELAALGSTEEHARVLEQQESDTRQEFLHVAEQLSSVRSAAALKLSPALERELRELAMPDCRVDVRVARGDRADLWAKTGVDEVEFFISPNPGEELRPLARVASGGELSRITLALRTLATTGAPGRTLVFDEIDAGIGGAAADAVGARLQNLARRFQILCITHLPQIAARTGAHFQIAKRVRADRTSSVVAKLDRSGREMEIARMIAGAEVSSKVLASARELMTARGESEQDTKGESATAAKAKGRKRGA